MNRYLLILVFFALCQMVNSQEVQQVETVSERFHYRYPKIVAGECKSCLSLERQSEEFAERMTTFIDKQGGSFDASA